MLKWMRLPALDAAGTNTNDTTEVQIGTGLTVPTWAKSVKGIAVHAVLLALTTKETFAGYFRLANDQNTLDPLNFPLPIASALTGAIATHTVEDHVHVPIEATVTPNDTVRLYAGLDENTTGVHTIQGYIAFSSRPAAFEMKSQKSAVIAGSTTANTSAGSATLSTIANRTSAVLGFWNYLYAYPTAAQSVGGYIKVTSAADNWQEQQIPTNMLPSGLGTQLEPFTKPMFAVPEYIKKHLSGYSHVYWEDEFPIANKAKTDFIITNYMDGTNTVAPAGRYGLIWKE